MRQRRKRYSQRSRKIAAGATIQNLLELHLVGAVAVLKRELRVQVGLEELVLRDDRQNALIHRLLISLALFGHRCALQRTPRENETVGATLEPHT